MERRNAWKQYDEAEIKALEAFCEEYKRFLDAGKTERECVAECVRIAKARGWKNLFDCEHLAPGDRVYVDWMHKCFVQFIVLYGKNTHHIIEAIFKGFARALAEAVAFDSRVHGVMSSKGTL